MQRCTFSIFFTFASAKAENKLSRAFMLIEIDFYFRSIGIAGVVGISSPKNHAVVGYSVTSALEKATVTHVLVAVDVRLIYRVFIS